MKYTVPNWAQSQMAKAAGLDPKNVAVELESDTSITFLQYMPRRRLLVSKADGYVIESKESIDESCKAGRQPVNQLDQLKIPQ